jgi:hypothetical protein
MASNKFSKCTTTLLTKFATTSSVKNINSGTKWTLSKNWRARWWTTWRSIQSSSSIMRSRHWTPSLKNLMIASKT